jgi:hypothetical protein
MSNGGRGGRRPPNVDTSDDFPDYAPRAIGGIARTSFSREHSSALTRETSRSSEGRVSSSRKSLPDALLMESPGAKQLAGEFLVQARAWDLLPQFIMGHDGSLLSRHMFAQV